MEIVKGCVDAWVAAASSLSVDATVALYDAEDGVLLGTVDIDENAARKGHGRVREYFTHFLDKDAVEPCFPPLKGTCAGAAADARWGRDRAVTAAAVTGAPRRAGGIERPSRGAVADGRARGAGALRNRAADGDDTEEDVMVLSPELIAYNGYYSFKLTKNGETNLVHAKFTYLYRKNSAGEWKIMIHNSGMTPKPTETLDGLKPEVW